VSVRRIAAVFAWLIVLACGLAVCAQAVALWRATRIEGLTFTRYHDPARDADAPAAGDSLADFLAETGLEDETGSIEAAPNRFMLGLLPGGPGKHAISVLTLAGPGAVVSLVALGGLALAFRRSSTRAARAGDSARTP